MNATAPGISPLEGMPRLRDRVCGAWGTAKFAPLLAELIVDARGGTRQGLPPDVADEILFLGELDKTLRCMRRAEELQIDYAKAYRLVDHEDQARLKKDALDDPNISRDMIITDSSERREQGERRRAEEKQRAVATREAREAREKDRKSFLGRYATALVVLIVIALGSKLLWPMLKSMLARLH